MPGLRPKRNLTIAMLRVWNNSVRNVLSGALAAYGWVSFFCFMYLSTSWHAQAPHQPNMALGEIYANNNHGSYAFFTAFQATTCSVMFSTSIPLFFAAVLISPKANIRGHATWYAFRYQWDSNDPKHLQRGAAIASAIATPFFVFLVGPSIIRSLNTLGFVANLG